MRNKAFSIFIFIILISSLWLPSYACNTTEEASLSDIATFWTQLRNEGILFVSDDGLLHIADNDYVGTALYEQILTIIEHCNIAIVEGILIATPDGRITINEAVVPSENTFSELSVYFSGTNVSNVTMPEADPTNISPLALDDSFHYVIGDDNLGHTCSGQYFDMLSICEKNYQFLLEYYESMLTIQASDPMFNAWLSTASLWVGRVAPNCAWDYKVSATYGPYNNLLCTYYDGSYHHLTAEYFGNLNYGYTGSLLFTLDTLHFGSSAVSGFDAADKADWPAIDEGYYLKVGQ